jgi:Zn-dependent protease with chaperone function
VWKNPPVTTQESAEQTAPGSTRISVPYTCLGCGWSGEFDSRFMSWCEGCGRGAQSAPEKPDKPRTVRRKERARVRSVAQFESLRTAGNLRPTTVTGVAVTALATLVHLTVVALFLGSAWLTFGPGQYGIVRFIGVLGIAVAFVGRPRLIRRKLKGKSGWRERSDSPLLFALLDKCAAELGVTTPSMVRFDDRFNASTSRRGFPPKPYLVIGTPLWLVLSGQERIALLGHELAHQANGDVSHGIWASWTRWR